MASSDAVGLYDEENAMVLRINTHGPTHPEVEADRCIVTCKEDNDKRKAVKLERPDTETAWGFTLQSYGVYDSHRKRIENYTFVDYVDRNSPAFIAGMKKGDIIFGLNGKSTDGYSHESLVGRLKSCDKTMRMVLVNGNICQKVELHQRKQKLQTLLRQKQYELNALEKREAALFYNARARLKHKELSEQKAKQSTKRGVPQLSQPAAVRTETTKTSTDSTKTVDMTNAETPKIFSVASVETHSIESGAKSAGNNHYLETSFTYDNNQPVSTTVSTESASETNDSKQSIDVRPKTYK